MHSAHNLTCSFEGDNFVLDYQVVRAALKAFKTFSSNKTPSLSTLSPFTRFLRHLSGKPDPSQPLSWHDPHTAVTLLEQRALCAVRNQAIREADPDASAAQRVARAVTEAFVAGQVEGFIHNVPSQLAGQEAHAVGDVLLLVCSSLSISLPLRLHKAYIRVFGSHSDYALPSSIFSRQSKPHSWICSPLGCSQHPSVFLIRILVRTYLGTARGA